MSGNGRNISILIICEFDTGAWLVYTLQVIMPASSQGFLVCSAVLSLLAAVNIPVANGQSASGEL